MWMIVSEVCERLLRWRSSTEKRANEGLSREEDAIMTQTRGNDDDSSPAEGLLVCLVGRYR